MAKKKKTAAPILVGARLDIGLGQIVPSPDNPRQVFDEAELRGVADTMKDVGVLQDLLVRPLPNGEDGGERYELIAGERRLRAAELAGLETVPCRVLELDEKNAARLRFIENDQRVDLSPLERALGYRKAIEQHGFTVDEIALQIGKPTRWVRDLLKLTTAPDFVQEAVKAGTLPLRTALLICRVPDPTQRQRVALRVLANRPFSDAIPADVDPDKEPMSSRATQAMIEQSFQRELKGCPWKLSDKKLLPTAGSCTACPKRAGKAAETDPDTYGALRADTCLDPLCYQIKLRAFIIRLKEEWQAKGAHVLDLDNHYQLSPLREQWAPLDTFSQLGWLHTSEGQTVRDFLTSKGLDWSGAAGLAVFRDGTSAELVSVAWLREQLCPADGLNPEQPARKPKAPRTQCDGGDIAAEGGPLPAPLPELETPPRRGPTQKELDRAAIALARDLIITKLAARLADVSAGERAAQALEGLALAAVCAAERNCYGPVADEMLRSRWKLADAFDLEGQDIGPDWQKWLAGKPARELLGVIVEALCRLAVDHLADEAPVPQLLALADSSRQEVLAQVAAELEPGEGEGPPAEAVAEEELAAV